MNTKAFTLVEVMISLGILSFVLLAGYGVLQAGNTIFVKDEALLVMQQQTRDAMNRIVKEVRQASSQTITSNYNGTTNDKIVFTIPTATGIQYYLNGTNLVRQYPSGTTNNIASNISVLKFTLTASLLQIQITANQVIYSVTTSFSLTDKVRLRNE